VWGGPGKLTTSAFPAEVAPQQTKALAKLHVKFLQNKVVSSILIIMDRSSCVSAPDAGGEWDE